ncbi:hypothetical protein TWF730_008800 [Orbilia blumenaviensis]|uniref:Uncharacterized protein n=1 Tax=Orbilia blumenaviensis TaxID=1796055 RepID=A0AAV9V3Q3_9PEZI
MSTPSPELTILLLFLVNILIVYGTYYYITYGPDRYHNISKYRPSRSPLPSRGPQDSIPLSYAFGHDPHSRNPPPLFFDLDDPDSLVRELLRNNLAGLYNRQNTPFRYIAVYEPNIRGVEFTIHNDRLKELVEPHTCWRPVPRREALKNMVINWWENI